eukprot:4399558-Pleurochrysis_carterae.AAC.1
MPVFAATGATATAARFVIVTGKGAAQASSAWSVNVRASRSAASATERRGACLKEGARSAGKREPEHAIPGGVDKEAHGGNACYTQKQEERGRHDSREARRSAFQSAMTASQARTGKSQLWARPCHPQL